MKTQDSNNTGMVRFIGQIRKKEEILKFEDFKSVKISIVGSWFMVP